MSEKDREEIVQANMKIKDIRAMHEALLLVIKNQPSPAGLPTTVSVQDGKVVVDCFGYEASAIARPIKNKDALFLMEYGFYIGSDDERIMVAQVYLGANGVIYGDLGSSHICDYNNIYSSKNIAERVMKGALNSALFTASV